MRFSISIHPDWMQPANCWRMKPITLSLIAIAGALTLGACDSKEENARENTLERKADNLEDTADAVRKDAERKADALESQKNTANPSSTNSALENAADAKRNAAESTADSLEKKADAEREKK